MTMRMRVCQHCQESFELASTGRPPRYCSATCRKAAWEKRRLNEAVAVAVAKAVAAEQRRAANRGNETRQTPVIRGNETPPQVRAPQPVQPPEPQQTELVLPEGWQAPLPPRRNLSRRRAGMEASPMPFGGDESEPQQSP
jgi:hypothetical protein